MNLLNFCTGVPFSSMTAQSHPYLFAAAARFCYAWRSDDPLDIEPISTNHRATDEVKILLMHDW
jgi:hypothetical protein